MVSKGRSRRRGATGGRPAGELYFDLNPKKRQELRGDGFEDGCLAA